MSPPAPSCICGHCRTCKHRAAQAKYRAKNRRRLNAEHAAWAAAEERRARRRERWAATDRLVRRAHRAVRSALARGELVRPDVCEQADRGDCLGKIEGHHDDYAKPLEVRWLCQRHHAEADREREEQAA